MPDNLPFEIDCREVHALMAGGEQFLLLDVRTPDEHVIANIPAATLIPMQEIQVRLEELSPHRDGRIVAFCHHGGRSERVAAWLRQQGFAGAQNMVGGIDAWAVEVDQSLRRY